jgi:tetraacyldisaccharide 4'-kinase
MRARPAGSVEVPVLCIGNFVVGGGGKTPTALAIARVAQTRGLKPGFLSRGYGGRISGPQLVSLNKHNAHDVGDEPLLLARIAPTVISADRLAGARLLVESGCDFIIMDDGFQNPRLLKDYSLIAVDARRGIGNGFPLPAGPLRVGLREQLMRASAVLLIGDQNGADPAIRRAARSGCPVYQAKLRITDTNSWKDKWLIAYAGIADPEKFFATLRSAGANLAHVVPFGDHHFYTEEDVSELLDRAKLMKAKLVTTTKDFVRLKGMGESQTKLAKASAVLEINLEFEDDGIADLIIETAVEKFEARMLHQASARESARA